MRAWWVLWVAACSSAPPQAPAPPATATPVASIPVDAAAADTPAASIPVDAAVADAVVADVTAAPEPWRDKLTKPPPVKGPVTPISETKTVTVGGVKITMGRSNHKHYADGGGSIGMWSFKLTRGGKSTSVEFRSQDDGFEAELVAHGVFFVLRHLSYYEFEIVLAGKSAPRPLTEEQCDERIDKAAVNQALPRSGGAGHSLSNDHGIVRHTERPWVGHCGLFSKRVWFTAAPPRDRHDL